MHGMKPLQQLSDEALVQALQQARRELPDAPLAWQQSAMALFSAQAAPASTASALKDTAAALGRLVRAALTFDSWAAPALAGGMRSLRSPTRHLLYSAEGRDIDLRINPLAGSQAGQFSLSGQILGPDETGRIELLALESDGTSDGTSEGQGPAAAQGHEGTLDALGEFRIDGVPAGLYRLTLHVGDAPIVVQPLEVGVPCP
jgi:hypothetical protein